jgi:hypothetical protein
MLAVEVVKECGEGEGRWTPFYRSSVAVATEGVSSVY